MIIPPAPPPRCVDGERAGTGRGQPRYRWQHSHPGLPAHRRRRRQHDNIGRHGGLPAVALGLASAGLKLAGGILALALVRPWGRAIPRAWLLPCAAGASAVLACYGAIQVTAGSLVLSRAVRPASPVDWTALGWHALVWDMWFLIWGILMATAATAWWRQGRRRGPAASLTARNGHADLA